MNITSHGQFKSSLPSGDLKDDKMDQVRELLFGEYERLNNARFSELEARVKELELGVHQRLDALQARLVALAADVSSDQKTAFDELARGIAELGERIRTAHRRDQS